MYSHKTVICARYHAAWASDGTSMAAVYAVHDHVWYLGARGDLQAHRVGVEDGAPLRAALGAREGGGLLHLPVDVSK